MSRKAPSFRDLHQFLAALKERGDVVEIDAEVDPRLELAEIHRRIIAAGGPALLFRNVKGGSFPVLTNLFGTLPRVELAFSDRPRRVIEELAKAPEELVPPTPGRLWKKRDLLMSLAKVGLKRRRSGPVSERRSTRLDLPALTCWAEDGGPFVTLPLVMTQHPDTGVPNLGMYRMQVHDAESGGLHWQIGKGGGFHHLVAEERGEPLPVNVFLGGPPSLILGAIAPLPENVPELLLASLVLGERLRLAANPDGPLPLAADAEFTLVGEALPGVRRPEGPFGDHYGYYSLKHDYPVFRLKAMHHRSDAIYPATVVGKPRQEDFFIGDFLQEMLDPLFPLVMPGVRDLWSYGETGYHSLSAAVVQERYKREAMASAFRILGEGQLSLTKFLLVIDAPLDLKDFRAVLVHLLERTDFRTDLYVLSNLSMDTLDYAGPVVNEGSKGVLLGLGEKRRDLPTTFEGNPPPEVRDVRVFCPGCLVVEGPAFADEPELAARVCAHEAFAKWPLIVIADDAAQASKSPMNFLWVTFTRFDPATDIHARSTKLVRHHPSYEPPVAIDARMKPGYPDELFCDPDTAQRVDDRWSEYFPKGQEMGDSARAHLD